MPLHTRRRWTRAEVLAIPEDGRRYELVDGELLVSPSPIRGHQRCVRRLLRLIDSYVEDTGIGETVISPADLSLDSGQLVQPDIFVAEAVTDVLSSEWEDVGIPMLVVEILSPSTEDYDRGIKRRLYQRSGVPVYWIVDLYARHVEVWTPEAVFPSIVRDRLEWQPRPAIAPMVINLPEFFGEVLR